ncbi:transcriptional regulator, HxlR family [Anaerocolumna jejuensis DSM 15929]|uniref:Transcriptional regulator, HxlR family n=1 Tax=Anaerocolumna jejuensis DSM 15929 TaxID=1121322 RepID=A0A1M6W257_9FIRM|nr:helix-turn-helix domain-containing protein [Anaerocolumna jejuensis]SHK87698.1 transcriptional regulator, HxlR family [Anaerocolumna jejuensis DSM 15929]
MKKKAEDEKPYYIEKCPVIRALDILGGKWRLAIIWELSHYESIRYNELKRHLCGITNIMLTRSLQALEQHGLVERKEFCQIPPHVEYSITESCKALLPALEIINEWGKTRAELIKNQL